MATELKFKGKMHWYACDEAMFLKLVSWKLLRTLYTSEEVYQKVCQFAHLMKHEIILVAESSGTGKYASFLCYGSVWNVDGGNLTMRI